MLDREGMKIAIEVLSDIHSEREEQANALYNDDIPKAELIRDGTRAIEESIDIIIVRGKREQSTTREGVNMKNKARQPKTKAKQEKLERCREALEEWKSASPMGHAGGLVREALEGAVLIKDVMRSENPRRRVDADTIALMIAAIFCFTKS